MGLIGLVALTVFSVATMLLWNWLLPGIFGLPHISFWQALGLLALARLLFGGFGGHHFMSGRHYHGRRHGWHHGNPIREKWANMSDEERKEFMQNMMKERFGHCHHAHFFDKREGSEETHE